MQSSKGQEYAVSEAAVMSVDEKQRTRAINEAYVVFAKGTRDQPIYVTHLPTRDVLEMVRYTRPIESKFGGSFWWLNPNPPEGEKPF